MRRLAAIRAFALAAAFLAAMLHAGALRAQEAVAQLVGAAGEVSRAEGDVWVPMAPGAMLGAGDRIATGGDGWAEIRFASGVRLTLGARTLIRIDPSSQAATRDRPAEVLSLIGGIVGAVLGDGGGGFEIRSALVIAAARSTEWSVSSDPEADAVFVEEGEVEVRPAGAARAQDTRSYVLSAGEGVTATYEQGLGAPVRWGAPRVAAARARLARPAP
jgi:ferric-dicitrate binding protein FerR (iron transport regulator)